MLQANGIYAKILLKLNFTCEECIPKVFLQILINVEVLEKKIEITKKRLSNDLKKIFG
jgi:hypothetical protein